jgi:hypothetical protein
MAHVSLRKHARASLACSKQQQQLEAKQTLKFLFTLGSTWKGKKFIHILNFHIYKSQYVIRI